MAEERSSPFSFPMELRRRPTACPSLNHSQDIMNASMFSANNVKMKCVTFLDVKIQLQTLALNITVMLNGY